MRTCLTILLTALSTTVAHAKLEIRDIQASYGQLGPERKSSEYVAGDQVYYRYNITDVRTDADGNVRGELRIVLTDAKGEVLLRQESPLQQKVAFGGESIPANASIQLTTKFPAGEYELTLEFADLIAKETASFKRKFTVKPVELALVGLRFYQDAQGRVPARVGGVVSQSLFMRMTAVGFDRSQGEIDVEMELRLLDAKGNPLMPKPIRATVHSEKPEEVKGATTADFNAEVALNRAGDFLLRISITDKMTKKSVNFESPLRVTPP